MIKGDGRASCGTGVGTGDRVANRPLGRLSGWIAMVRPRALSALVLALDFVSGWLGIAATHVGFCNSTEQGGFQICNIDEDLRSRRASMRG